ncbi:hypothetical protein THAOC_00717, partial [Thalassiosira oceanica]
GLQIDRARRGGYLPGRIGRVGVRGARAGGRRPPRPRGRNGRRSRIGSVAAGPRSDQGRRAPAGRPGEFSSVAFEGRVPAPIGGHGRTERGGAVSEHRSEVNSDVTKASRPRSDRAKERCDATINGSKRGLVMDSHSAEIPKHSKIVQSEPEAGGAGRRRERRAETAQFLPCGAFHPRRAGWVDSLRAGATRLS